MKIALFGGTFNPVHSGHLLMAEAARDDLDLDQIIFLPAGHPPHKKNPQTSARHRWAMLRLALAGNRAFQASDWDLRQSRAVYTYEALERFHQLYPRAQLHFLIGSDSLKHLHQWRQGLTLLDWCPFLVVERPGVPWKSFSASLRRKVKRVSSEPVPFSSAVIRRDVRAGRSIRYRVPATVERYIQRHRLYREAE